MSNISKNSKKNAQVFFLLSLLLCPIKVFSCGMTLHLYMADKAFSLIEDDALKTLLDKEQTAYRNGSFYPDSGYAVDSSYGEGSHWSPFLNHYILYLQKKCPLPFSEECRKIFAHYLGSMAHALSDVLFDKEYLTRVAKEDFNGNASVAQEYTDIGLDFISVLEENRFGKIPLPYVPADDLSAIYNTMNDNIPADLIRKGVNMMIGAQVAERAGSLFTYLYYKGKMPWGSANYMNSAGGVNHNAKMIAGFWQKSFDIIVKSGFKKVPYFVNEGNWPRVVFTVRACDPLVNTCH